MPNTRPRTPSKLHPKAAMRLDAHDNREAKWRAMELMWEHTDEVQFTKNLELSVEDRLTILEKNHARAWSLLVEMTWDALDSIQRKEQWNEEHKPADLPVIMDRRSFMQYVAAVTSRLHMGHCTGPEARALLYAAQLALSGLKGDARGLAAQLEADADAELESPEPLPQLP